MRDCIEIGPTPTEERCAQVGEAYYAEKARKECQAYVRQLLREYGKEPEGARVRVKSSPHDFRNYYEAVCEYEDSIPEAVNYAFGMELGCEKWDKEAREELGLK